MKVCIDTLTHEEMSVLVEAAFYAMRYHYKGLANHLDLSDEHLKPMIEAITADIKTGNVKYLQLLC